MKNFARVDQDGKVIETFKEKEDIKIGDVFPPDFAATFIEVPGIVSPGWRTVKGAWTAPEPFVPVAPEVVHPSVGPIAFQMLFTPEEAVKAAFLRDTDPVLQSFWKLIDDPRTDTVDLNLKTVQNAIEYTLNAVKVAGVTVDVPKRKAEILTGIVK